MGLFEQWNNNRFSIYKNEEKTVLKLIESLAKWFDTTLVKVDEVDTLSTNNKNNKVSYTDLHTKYKIDENANFNGSWQGLDKPTLSDEGMKATVEKINYVDLPLITENLNEKASQISTKAEKSYVDNKILTIANGTPKGTYVDLTALQNAFPNGDSNNYIVQTDGHIYYWNSLAWTDTGIQYQSSGIAENSIKYKNVLSKSALSNINSNNIFENPTLENNFEGWLTLNNDEQTANEVTISDSFSKGVFVPNTISGHNLIQRVPLSKLVSGEYFVKCRKRSTTNVFNGRIILHLSNAVFTTLVELYKSESIPSDTMEHTFTFDKETLLAQYPMATYLTVYFVHNSATSDCTFYEPFLGIKSNGTTYNNFIYDTLQNSILNNEIGTFDGDSICQGISNGGGYAKIISEREGMKIENKGIGGGTIAKETYYDDNKTNPRHWICDSVNDLRIDADYIIFEGGVNDYNLNVPLGTLTNDYTGVIDNTTFYGGLEHLFRQALVRFKGKKVGFIIIHKANNYHYTPNSIGLKMEEYYNAIIKTCEKYSVPVCDLYKNSGLVTAITDLKTLYTSNSDGLHPNSLGYEKYYTPKISAWMKTL